MSNGFTGDNCLCHCLSIKLHFNFVFKPRKLIVNILVMLVKIPCFVSYLSIRLSSVPSNFWKIATKELWYAYQVFNSKTIAYKTHQKPVPWTTTTLEFSLSLNLSKSHLAAWAEFSTRLTSLLNSQVTHILPLCWLPKIWDSALEWSILNSSGCNFTYFFWESRKERKKGRKQGSKHD